MKFHHRTADVWIPDGSDPESALARTTHLGVGAHQDDLEIMAFHGIVECFGHPDRWFSGVTLTDGRSSPRSGSFARYTEEQMRRARRKEQRKAAEVGRYSAMIQLDYSGAAVRDPGAKHVREDLEKIFLKTRPEILYTHNPADRHETHVAVVVRCIEVLRGLGPSRRPGRVYGCEVWRSLDWLSDGDKVALDVTGKTRFAKRLLEVFESQIAGGKRYDLATLGRRRANATYHQTRAVDRAEEMLFVLDLTPLLTDPTLDLAGFVLERAEKLKREIGKKIRSVTAPK